VANDGLERSPRKGRAWAGFVAAALAGLLVVARPGVAGGKPNLPRGRIVARAGGSSIDDRDLRGRLGILGARGVKGAGEPQALVELLGETIEAEVAGALGVAPTPEEIKALDDHATRTSREPETLAKIRKLFGADRERYARQFLAPKVTNLKLHEYFARDRELHADARRRVESVWARVRAGEVMESVAAAVGGERRQWTVGGPADVPPELGAAGVGTGEDPFLPVVRGLADGALYGRVVENETSLSVVRRLRHKDDGIEVEAVIIRKRPYDDWYREQAGRIRIEILDLPLAGAVCAAYGRAWWLQPVCAPVSER
jgi:hypothetical protein